MLHQTCYIQTAVQALFKLLTPATAAASPATPVPDPQLTSHSSNLEERVYQTYRALWPCSTPHIQRLRYRVAWFEEAFATGIKFLLWCVSKWDVLQWMHFQRMCLFEGNPFTWVVYLTSSLPLCPLSFFFSPLSSLSDLSLLSSLFLPPPPFLFWHVFWGHIPFW